MHTTSKYSHICPLGVQRSPSQSSCSDAVCRAPPTSRRVTAGCHRDAVMPTGLVAGCCSLVIQACTHHQLTCREISDTVGENPIDYKPGENV